MMSWRLLARTSADMVLTPQGQNIPYPASEKLSNIQYRDFETSRDFALSYLTTAWWIHRGPETFD